jgi:hypothetical protein
MFRTILAVLTFSVVASASTITFTTPTGSMTSGPVNASATITTATNSVFITLTNLQANPTDVAQLLSDFDFVLSNGATTGTLGTTSGQEVTVNSNGTFSLGGTVSTGWGLNNNVGGGLQLTALGFPIAPAHLIIGPSGAGNLYSNANGSIAGNGPHNPFLNQTATFNIAVTGVTAATTVTGATFSFGTTAGVNVPGTPGTPSVPEPISSALVGTGLIGLFYLRRRNLRS